MLVHPVLTGSCAGIACNPNMQRPLLQIYQWECPDATLGVTILQQNLQTFFQRRRVILRSVLALEVYTRRGGKVDLVPISESEGWGGAVWEEGG
jgi:hypothetical protein